MHSTSPVLNSTPCTTCRLWPSRKIFPPTASYHSEHNGRLKFNYVMWWNTQFLFPVDHIACSQCTKLELAISFRVLMGGGIISFYQIKKTWIMAQMQSTGVEIFCWHFILIAGRNSSISFDPALRLHCNCRISRRMSNFVLVTVSARQTLAWSLLFRGCWFD